MNRGRIGQHGPPRPALRLLTAARHEPQVAAAPVYDDAFLSDFLSTGAAPAGRGLGYRSQDGAPCRGRRSPCRPGDRLQSLEVADDAALRALAREAELHCLDHDTAITLTLEHQLIAAHLAAHGRTEALEVAADAAALSRPLTPGLSSYLRQLTAGTGLAWRPPRVAEGCVAALVPVRIIDRLGDEEPVALRRPRLDRALAWEIAAVTCAATMMEWALQTLLAGYASPSA